ncbi:hypothetical protein CRUP_001852, partial [Coryphaenoides rupestris]
MLRAVALPLVAERGQADQVGLLHQGVHLVVGRLVPGGGHQVHRHLRQIADHLRHVPLRDQTPHHMLAQLLADKPQTVEQLPPAYGPRHARPRGPEVLHPAQRAAVEVLGAEGPVRVVRLARGHVCHVLRTAERHAV